MTASPTPSSSAGFVLRGDLPQRIHQVIEPWVALQPGAPALEQGDTVLTYGELEAAVTGAARRLAAQGLRAGDRLLLVAENSIEVLEHLPATVTGKILKNQLRQMAAAQPQEAT